MRAKTVSTFADVLSQHESFETLVASFQQHQVIAERIQQFLPGSLKSHVKFGCLKKGVLYLLVQTNSWATQCRYQTSELLSYLRQYPDCSGIGSIQIRVETEAFTQIDKTAPLKSGRSAPPLSVEELIRVYALSALSPAQKEACDAWLLHIKKNK